MPCYGDAARDLGSIIDEMVRAAGKSIDRTTRDHLTGLLGGDRQTSRREIEKLLLYVGTDPAVQAEHIDAVVGDTAQREQAIAQQVLAQRLAAETLDVTLPGRGGGAGGLHPITLTTEFVA